MYICKVLFTTKLALLLILGYVVARTVLLPERTEKTLTPASALGASEERSAKTVDSQDTSFEDYAQIMDKDPFGTLGQIANSDGMTGNSTEQQRTVSEELGIALFGTVSGSPEVARAVVKDLKTGTFNLYKTGQTVASASIESIKTNMVTLLHNGERKILMFNGGHSSGNSNTKALFSQTAGSAKAVSQITDAGSVIQTGIKAVGTILSKAVIEPFAVDGRIEGLKITGLENLNAFETLGLKNGDVICMVNGHQLTSKQRAFQVLKKAKAQSSIDLELLRDNEIKNLSFNLR